MPVYPGALHAGILSCNSLDIPDKILIYFACDFMKDQGETNKIKINS